MELKYKCSQKSDQWSNNIIMYTSIFINIFSNTIIN